MFQRLERSAIVRIRKQSKRSFGVLGITLLAAALTSLAGAQAPPVPNSLTFEVTNGNCSPQSISSTPGRTIIAVKMTSSQPQHIALSTTGPNRRYLFEHAQVGSSERWTTMIYIPAGTYELMSSLNGNKCTVTVN
jgi:hypothetical protein